jgi:hypothetical protein
MFPEESHRRHNCAPIYSYLPHAMNSILVKAHPI